jgi:hypothetical protein
VRLGASFARRTSSSTEDLRPARFGADRRGQTIGSRETHWARRTVSASRAKGDRPDPRVKSTPRPRRCAGRRRQRFGGGLGRASEGWRLLPESESCASHGGEPPPSRGTRTGRERRAARMRDLRFVRRTYGRGRCSRCSKSRIVTVSRVTRARMAAAAAWNHLWNLLDGNDQGSAGRVVSVESA